VLTKEQARALVVAEIERPPKYNYPGSPRDLVVVDEHTIERVWGWVFFYNSKRYLETREFRCALAGNAPYIVNRQTGELRVTGTAHPIEDYIAEYERSLTTTE
jgi:hypothetical protein